MILSYHGWRGKNRHRIKAKDDAVGKLKNEGAIT